MENNKVKIGVESRLSKNHIERDGTGGEEEKHSNDISTVVDVCSVAQPLVSA